jgi:type II secretory pathway pseudopilin PulG
MNGLRHPPASRKNESGFTLLEAFIVLVIVALIGAISVPAIMNTLTLQKLATATNSFVNQVDFARVQAASRSRAYLVRVELSDGTNSGAIRLDEGDSSACTQASFEDDGAKPEPVENVRVLDFSKELSEIHIVAAEPSMLVDAGVARLCIRPDGRVLSVNGATIPPPEGYAAGEAVFRLQLYVQKAGELSVKGTEHLREIVIPYNGIPKVRNVTE